MPPAYGRLLEDHDVLGESPGLVAEKDLHLPKLLVQVGAVAPGRLVALRVVQVAIPGEELGPEELLQLNRDVEADRDDVVEDQQEHDPVLEN